MNRSLAGALSFFLIPTVAQAVDCLQPHDCEYFNLKHYGGDRTCLAQGESFETDTVVLELGPSFKVLTNNAAIRIDRTGPPDGYRLMYVYSEVTQPFIAGTEQYSAEHIRVSCLKRAEIPQPDIFIPVDAETLNPFADSTATDYIQLGIARRDRPVLALRRAFLWENSEDHGCPHGPAGDIVVNVVDPGAVHFYETNPDTAYQFFVDDPGIWQGFRLSTFDLPGPVYYWRNGCVLGFAPDAYDEWLDGPWGVLYSNLGVWDWGPSTLDEVGVIISEADASNPEDFLGAGIIRRTDRGPKLIPLRMFGWVELENVTAGPEATADFAEAYVYPGWDGTYPVGLTDKVECSVDCDSCILGMGLPQVTSCSIDNSVSTSPACLFGSCLSTCPQPCSFPPCPAGHCQALVDMPEGRSFRPFGDLDRALSSVAPGSILGVFRGGYAERCIAGGVSVTCPGAIAVECTSTQGSVVTFEANVSENCQFGASSSCDHPTGSVFPLGNTTVHCTATGQNGSSAGCSFGVDVVDTTPPEIECPARVTIECSTVGGTPSGLLPSVVRVKDSCDASPSISHDGPAILPLGTTTLTFTATDASGNATWCAVDVQVVDTTPPEIGLEAIPSTLWPPNHKMVPVRTVLKVFDACDAAPDIALESIIGSEPDNGLGDGNTEDDIQGADIGSADFSVRLRSERAGRGLGRTYRVTYSATDVSGNRTVAGVNVEVTHDRKDATH